MTAARLGATLGCGAGATVERGVQETCNQVVAVETTYTNLRQKLASVLDQVVDDREVVIVRRRGARDVGAGTSG